MQARNIAITTDKAVERLPNISCERSCLQLTHNNTGHGRIQTKVDLERHRLIDTGNAEVAGDRGRD